MSNRPLRIVLVLLALLTAGGVGAQAGGEEVERDRRLVHTYRQMLAEDPYQDYALRRLLEVSHAAGGLQGLVEAYRQRVEEAPEDAAAWVVLGHLHRAADREDEAVEAYRRAADLRERDPGPRAALARLHRRAQRWDEAIAAWEEAVARTRSRTRKQEILKAAAETALEAGRPERAEAWFEKLTATEPGNLHLRMEHASTLARLGHPERALEAWEGVRERAGRKLEHLVVVWREMAGLQEQLGRLDAAEATLREALEETPRGHWARPAFVEGLVDLYRRRDALRDLIAELEPRAERSREIRLVVARLYEEVGDDARALELFRRAVRDRPRDVDARLKVIEILERVGRTEEVLDAYRALIRVAPHEPRHGLRLAELLLRRGRVEEGFRRLERMSRRHPGDPGVHQRIIDLTMRYGDAGERGRIEREYRILMRLEPGEEAHVISLGEFYWARGDEERAHELWRRLLRMGDGPGEGHFRLAEVYADHGLPGKASEQFEAAIAAEPDNPRYARAYALWLERQRRHGEALKQWERVIEAARAADEDDPRRRAAVAEARRHTITLWEQTGRLGAEIRDLERRFEAEPPDEEAGYALALAHLRSRRLEDAEAVLERLRRLDPDHTAALRALEEVYTRQNRLEDAISVLEDLARLESRSAYEHLHRAAALALALDDEERALAFTRRVADLNPADPGAHVRVGELFQRLGRLDEAAEAWRQALALDPRNDDIRFRLAAVYRDLDEPIREERVLLEIVRESNDPGHVLEAGRRLLSVAARQERLEDVERALRPLIGGRGRREDVHLHLAVDLYETLARRIRWSDAPEGERRERARKLGERALEPLLDALDGDDVATRARALRVLRVTRPPGAVPALARLAGAPDATTRIRAAVALGGVGTDSAVEALGRLSASQDRDVREAAVWALGLTGTQEATRYLTSGAVAGTPRLRMLTALALGRTGGPEAVDALILTTRESHPGLRLAATWALARLATPETLQPLASALLSGRPREARLAIWGLGRADTEAARDTLVEALWSRDVEAGVRVADALLGPGRSDDNARRLDVAYASIADPEEGRLSLDLGGVLGLSAPPRPGKAARLDALEALEPGLRARVSALVSGSERDHLSVLLEAVVAGDGELALRPLLPAGTAPEQASSIARRLLEPHAEALAEGAAGEWGPALRAPALDVLSRLASGPSAPEAASRALPLALEASRAPEPDVREQGVRAVGRLAPPDDEAAVAAIVRAAERTEGAPSDPLVRASAARALGRFEPGLVAEAHARLLGDPDPTVRRAAVESVHVEGPGALVDAVIRRLEDPVPEVALAALEHLAPLADAPRVRAALERTARSARPGLRVRARAVLGASPPPTGAP
ncbi:MAG: HEAT repeat domain-containing protein [Myxococcota bacterium]